MDDIAGQRQRIAVVEQEVDAAPAKGEITEIDIVIVLDQAVIWITGLIERIPAGGTRERSTFVRRNCR